LTKNNIKSKFGLEIQGFDDEKYTDAILTLHERGLNLHWKGTFTKRDKGDQFIRYGDITSIALEKGLVYDRIDIMFAGGKIKIGLIDKVDGSDFVSSVQEQIANLRDINENNSKKSNPIDEIKKAKELLDSGAITEEEFVKLKKRII